MLPALTPHHITTDDISFLYAKKEIAVHVLRLDQLHPVISGNKWFKLRYYLEEARAMQKTHILTFGGAWSNHIIATAAACRALGLQATGIIRGEEPATYSSTLRQAQAYGMQLVFIPRSQYREGTIENEWLTDHHYVIPEGGYGATGARGAATILAHSTGDYTHIGCAIGTGTMMAGLINAATGSQTVTGIPVLKNNSELQSNVQALLAPPAQPASWQLLHDYHFGGYAKHQPGLISFMNDFYRDTGIPSDFVYTGKLFYAIADLIAKDHFAAGSRLLLIHSGGLQGNDSLAKGTLIF